MHSRIFALRFVGKNNQLNDNVDFEQMTESDLPIEYMTATMCDYVQEIDIEHWWEELQWLVNVYPLIKLSSSEGKKLITIDIKELKDYNIDRFNDMVRYVNEHTPSYRDGKYELRNAIFEISEFLEEKFGFYIIDRTNNYNNPETIIEMFRDWAEWYYDAETITYQVEGVFDYHS